MPKKTNQQIAIEVIAGKWGNGADRRARLEAAGYSYDGIQSIVNALMSGEPVDESHDIQITGTKTLAIEFDIREYNGIEISLIDGGFPPDPEPTSETTEVTG